MEIKGTGIKTTREFVKTNFPDKYKQWVDSLPEKSRVLYSSPLINMAGWYPMVDAYIVPVESIIVTFYDGDVKTGAEALGKFSADMALKGIYKLYMIIATPQNLMQKSSVMFSTFYNPCEINVQNEKHKSTMQIPVFENMTKSMEYRIAGWCVKALEMCGCKNISYRITKSLTEKDNLTEILFKWS
jgi:hypothetical protein